MKGWLDKYGKEINANEGRSSASKEWIGEGYSNVGRNYSPAWGGQFQDGGNMIPTTADTIHLNQLTDDYIKLRNTYHLQNVVPSEPSSTLKGMFSKLIEKGGKSYKYKTPKNRKESIKESKKVWEKKDEIENFAKEKGISPTSKKRVNLQSTYYNDKDIATEILDTPNEGEEVDIYPTPVQTTTTEETTITPMWNVEYFDPTTKKTETKQFATDKEAEAFFQDPANQASHKYSNVSSVGRFAMGGSIPGAVGFTYARTAGAAPSNGPYAKKTMPSAQIGRKIPIETPIDPETNPTYAKSISEAMDFTNQWINSPMYQKMLMESVGGDQNLYNKIDEGRRAAIDPNNISYYEESIEPHTGAESLTHSVGKLKGKSSIYLNKNTLYPDWENNIAHELSHVTDQSGDFIPNMDAQLMRKYAVRNVKDSDKYERAKERGAVRDLSGFIKYVNKPTETRARINSLRKLMLEQGVYDPFTQSFNKDMLGKYKQIPIPEDEQKAGRTIGMDPYQQLRLSYTDEEIEDMMNKISKSDGISNLDVAQNGMTFYQNGLDWKPKSISKNGGWLDKYTPQAQDGKFILPRFDMPRAASESTSRVVHNTVTGKQKSTATTGQKSKDIKASTSDMGKAKKREEQEKQQRIAERKAAKAFNEGKSKTFTFPTGETKSLDQMDWREKAYVSGKSVEGKGRFNENDEAWYDDWVNPVNWITEAAGSIGTAPYEAKVYDSNLPYIGAIASPLFMGRAMGSNSVNPFGKKFWTNEVSNKEFINNMLGGIPSMTKSLTRGAINLADRNLSSVGKNLARIEKEGKAAGLNPFEIAQNQMKKVGITSNQRQAYVPGISELTNKYITPVGYEGGSKGSKLSQIFSNIKKGGQSVERSMPERQDAWNLYLGMPQKNKTFALSNTSPALHRSYPAGSLEGMDIYNIRQNRDFQLYPNYSTDDTPSEYLKNLERSITYHIDPTVMGGYNARMTKLGTEYNDIWDLEPSISFRSLVPQKVSEHPMLDNVFFKKKTVRGVETATPREITIPVDKFIGKPFMSHGFNPSATSFEYIDDLSKSVQSNINILNPHVLNREERLLKLQKDLENVKNYKPKYKKGGVIKDDRGQWAHPGEITEIGSNQITMKGVPYPVLGISDTGDQQMMYPEQEYKFKGKKVTEYPMAQKGYVQPTTQDSLKLYNSQMALNKFYENEMKLGRLKKTDVNDTPWVMSIPELKENNLNFYRREIADRDRFEGSIFDELYKKYFNLTPDQVKKLEYQGLGVTKGGNEYQAYYKDIITPMQNLASPFAMIDSRIQPQRSVTYKMPDPRERYPGGTVTVYDYDPLAIKPAYLRSKQEQEQWQKKYGKPTTTTQTTQKPKKIPLVTGNQKDFDKIDFQSPLVKDKDGIYRNDLGQSFKFETKPKPKPEPSLKGDKSKAQTISTERKTPSGKIIERKTPDVKLSPIQNLPYRVDYIGEDGKPTHTNFASNKEGEAFMKEIQNRKMGISGNIPGGSVEGYYEKPPKKKKGGWLDKYN